MESNYLNLKQINGLCEFNLVEIILENWKLLYDYIREICTQITIIIAIHLIIFICILWEQNSNVII